MDRLALDYPVMPHAVTRPWGVVDPQFESFGFLRHNGVDLALAEGQEIRAPFDGRVTLLGYHARGSGRFACLVSDRAFSFPDGLTAHVELTFMHLSEALAKEGARVRRGDRIAKGGSTGTASGPHAHLSCKRVTRGIIGYRDLDRNDADNTFDPLPFWTGTYAASRSLDQGRERDEQRAG